MLGIRENVVELTPKLKGYNFLHPKLHHVESKVGDQEFTRWMNAVGVVLQANGKVAISLRGFDGSSSVEKFKLAYQHGGLPELRSTEWEMFQVGRQVQIGNLKWDRVTFYNAKGKK